MIWASDINEKIHAAIDGDVSLEDLEDWLDSESWNMHADSASEAVELASSALLLFSEFGLGYRSEQSLRHDLRLLLGDDREFHSWNFDDAAIPDAANSLAFAYAGT